MAIAYEAAITTGAAGAAAPYAEVFGNGTRRAKVRELGMFSQAATAAAKTQVIRPGNTPAGGTGTVVLQAQDPADAAGVTSLTTSTWTTTPTAAAVPLRQFDFNNVIGSGVIYTWPSDGELVVAAARGVGGLLVWNAGGSAGPASDLYVVASE